MKVLLISFFNDEAYGLRCIHSSLVREDIDTDMMFFKSSIDKGGSQDDKVKKEFTGDITNASDKEIDLLVNHIIDNGYDLVGFSLVSQHFNLYKKIYPRIKESSHVKIVIGGWQPSLNPEVSIQFTDFLCIGEGEEPMLELVSKLAKNEKTANIDNFWVKTGETVFKNPIRPLPRDLSTFPIPLYDHKYSYLIDGNTLSHEEPYFTNSRYGTFIGRGCPHKCTYCSNSYMAGTVYPGSWSRIRHRSSEHVKEELLFVKRNMPNIKSINFYDEVFAPNMDWIREFFSWYKKQIHLPFFCFFFPGSCSDEKARILAEAGLKGVWIGVQSGSQRVRKEIFKRNYSNANVLKQAEIFHRHGISVRYDFIFDNPFESFEESLESITMMLELPTPFSLNTFSLKYFPNTEITRMAAAAGIITDHDLDDNQKKDYDTYLIRKNTGNDDNKFINNLAFYISNIAGSPEFQKHKDIIHQIIADYRSSRDLTPVESLIIPFIH